MPDKELGELGLLTRGERLLIQRRRLGERQSEAALRHGVSSSMYGKWERDVTEGPAMVMMIWRLEAHERCLLYRRRCGKGQAEVAKDLGRCRLWINRMERGDAPCSELLGYWEQ